MSTPTIYDDEGYLLDPGQWSEAVAQEVAQQLQIELSAEHFAVIEATRRYYEVFELSPAMRPLVKYLGQQLGPDKGKSIYLLQLFRTPLSSDSPAKIIARIAGLPKPDNCL